MPDLRASLSRAVGRRIATWIHRRQGDDLLPVVLAARRIYILPTRAGLGLAILVLAMLVAGLNYQNGLALLLCFTLAALAMVAMLRCHQRLLGLQLDALHVEPAFAGQCVTLTLQLKMPRAHQALDLHLTARGHAAAATQCTVWDEGRAQLALALPAPRRGRWPLPALRLQTRAPFGLLRAWVWLHLPQSMLVYPAPVGTLPLPPGKSGTQASDADSQPGIDHWLGLRPHREGDGLRQVDWKRAARGGPLQVREFGGGGGGPRFLDPSRVPLPDHEARLSQVCAWLLQAEAAGEPWILRTTGDRFGPGLGSTLQRQALQALALEPPP